MFRWKKAWSYYRPCAACRAAGFGGPGRPGWNARCPTGRCKPGYWLDFFDRDGRRRRRKYPTAAARDAARRHIEEQINAWVAPPRSVPWSDLVQQYCAAQQLNAPKTQAKTDRVIALFTHNFAPTWTHAVTPAVLREYFARRSAGTLKSPPDPQPLGAPASVPASVPAVSPATLRGDYRILHGLMAFAVAERFAPDNPLDRVSLPRAPRRVKRTPTEAEWVRLLEVLEQPEVQARDPQAWHLLILLGVVTALREGVLLSLRSGRPPRSVIERLTREGRPWSWVELGDAETRHVGLLYAYTNKSHKESVHGLPPVVAQRLASRLASLPDGAAWVFPWRGFQRKAWRRIGRAAGVNVEFQALRRCGATSVAVAAARRAAQRSLDHESPQVTVDHYLDSPQVARAVAAALVLPALPPLPPYVEYHPAPRPGSPSARSG